MLAELAAVDDAVVAPRPRTGRTELAALQHTGVVLDQLVRATQRQAVRTVLALAVLSLGVLATGAARAARTRALSTIDVGAHQPATGRRLVLFEVTHASGIGSSAPHLDRPGAT